MVRGWFTVKVELQSGLGMLLHPRPGRIILVGPHHTFMDLATAIDLAFARWDLDHDHGFFFADGRRFGPGSDGEENDGWVDYENVRVGREVSRGDHFIYVFDFGDNWRHECEVIDSNLDPEEEVGMVPEQPVPIWGWGWIPDQSGRRTPDDGGADEYGDEDE